MMRISDGVALEAPNCPGKGKIPVLLHQDLNSCNPSGTDAENTKSVALAADFMNKGPFASLRVRAWGRTGANGNNKTVRILLGTTACYTTGAVAANNKDWLIEVEIRRLTPSTQNIISKGGCFNNTAILPGARVAGAVDLSAASSINLELTAATAATDITVDGFEIEAF